MQAYSRTMVDFLVLKFGILKVKNLLNGKCMSSNLACMPITNKEGRKVKKFILRFFLGKMQQMINKSGKKTLSLNMFWMILYLKTISRYQMHVRVV